MNLLFLTPQLPYPPHQGTSLRNFHIIRGLAQNNHITLLSFAEEGAGQEIAPQLSTLCEDIVTVPAPQRSMRRRMWQLVSRSQPDMALRLYSPEFCAALEVLLNGRSFDIAQIEGIEMAWSLPVLQKAAPNLPVVYDAHNAETLLQSRSGAADRKRMQRWPAVVYSSLQSSRLADYEAWVCNTVDRVTAVSEADRDTLQGLAGLPKDAVTVIPNSIDVSAYQAAGALPAEQFRFDVVFSGKMDYRPNVDAVLWFAEAVWPLIKKEVPNATWAVVGQKPHARLAGLAQLPDVTVTGWVPEAQPYLSGATVFVMPFRVGSGTRLKLIEALAAGKAVVSTRVGVEGFPVEDGQQLLVSDTAQEFSASTVTLLNNAGQRKALGARGQLFAQGYDWRVVIPKFQSLYDDIGSDNL